MSGIDDADVLWALEQTREYPAYCYMWVTEGKPAPAGTMKVEGREMAGDYILVRYPRAASAVTMVDRVAQAIYQAGVMGWGSDPHEVKDMADHMARAAIAAMREATPEMIAAGEQFERPVNVWSAMIDEALK